MRDRDEREDISPFARNAFRPLSLIMLIIYGRRAASANETSRGRSLIPSDKVSELVTLGDYAHLVFHAARSLLLASSDDGGKIILAIVFARCSAQICH